MTELHAVPSTHSSSSRSRRNESVLRGVEHMTEAQIKGITDQLRQDVIAHLWRHRWMKKVVLIISIFFAVWIFSIVASICFLTWWIRVGSGVSELQKLLNKVIIELLGGIIPCF